MKKIYKATFILFFIVLFVSHHSVNAQTDTEFWFGVPDITEDHCLGGTCPGQEPIYLRIATKELSSEIRVEIGDNRILVQPDTLIDPYTSFTVNLTPYVDSLENVNYGSIEERALHVTGTNKITAYFEEAEYYNPDIYSLKGSNALGTEFYIPTQNEWTNATGSYTPSPYGGFIITATQDGTTVNLDLTGSIWNDPGNTITLDKGETFSAVTDGAGVHLTGSHVTSDKPITMTIYDDSNNHPAGGCRDLIGDQLVPVDVVGHEYIAMRGNLDPPEKVFMVGTQDDTEVMIDSVIIDTIDAGEPLSYELTQEATHIVGSKPIYTHHVSGYGCEVGGAILPTIDGCTGSYDVFITRTSTQDFFLNMMIRKGSAVNEFYIEYEDGSEYHIPDEWFVDVPNTPTGDKWVTLGGAEYYGTGDFRGIRYGGPGDPDTLGIPYNEVVHISNEGGEPFHLGFNNGGSSSGCNYGYFSDFKVIEAEVYEGGTQNPLSEICFGETKRLTAAGGYEYTWGPDDLRSYLSDYKAQSPVVDAPPDYHEFEVRVQGGCNLDTTMDMPVQVYEEVKAKFQLDTSYGCSPLEVGITNNSVNEYKPYSYWNYGRFPGDESGYMDDTTLLYENKTDTVRQFDITAIIQNDFGCADTLTRNVKLNPFITDSIAPADTTGCNPLPVQFRNYTYGGNMDSTTYLWEFGDGNSSYDSIPEHTFQNPSGSDTTYTTIMTAESKFGCLSSDTAEITVHSYINASFTLDTIEGCSPITIQPDAKSYPGIDESTWYFEGLDTITVSGSNPDPSQQTYVNRSGTSDTLEVKLVVENIHGCQDSMSREVIIHPEVHADFAPMDTANCNPVTVGYRNKSNYSETSDTAGLSYYWDFGDGNTSTAFEPSHQFTNSTDQDTTYDVNLEVISPRGCTHDTTGKAEVYSYIKADFSASNVKGCSPLEVSVTNNSVGNINYYWFWDDNSLDTANADSSISNANFTKTYIYNTSDTVQTNWMTLIVANDQGCTDTMKREITVYPEVTAAFDPRPTADCNPYTVSFTNNSGYTGTGSNTNFSYSWEFDDGGSSSEFEPDHTFTNSLAKDTTYNVELAVESINGCVDTTDGNVTVRDYINAQFSVDDPVGCAPYTITIDEYASGGIDTYEWDWNGDGTVDSAYTTSPGTFTHEYQNTSDTIATFPLTLIVSNNDGCEDTLIREVKVYPDVEPQFTMNPTNEGCHPVKVDFTNNSTPSGTLNYTWDFGDGGTSNQEEPSHTFYNFSNTDSTSFKVELVAESDYYCTDSVSKRVYVHYNPKAKMDVNTTESCPPLNLTADNESTGGDTYTWDYGDGTDTILPNKNSVSHTYDNTGSSVANFDLQLLAETNYGCSDSTQLRLSVYPRVTADFTYDSAGCHPFYVQFNNESENADYYYWDFKDGVTSNLENPENRFENNTQSDKTFDVFLRASSEFNCKDSVTKPVTTYPSPNTAFAVTPTLQVFPNSTVDLDNNTNTGPWDYTWHFGDGETSTTKQPGEYTYDDYGEYSIMLEAESEHCYDSVSHDIIIIAPEPIADFTTDPVEGCQPLTVQFTDNSEYGENYFWDFDDGDTARTQNVEHTFTEAGTFYVKQTVSGEGGEDYAYKTVKVFKKPVADFEVKPKFVMLPDEKVAFYNLSKFEDMWKWDFGDGRTANKEQPKHLYRDTGRYDIRLEVESYEGCQDTLIKENLVQVGGKGSIRFPDAFTPSKSGPTGGQWKEGQNLDKVNDIFHPVGEGVMEYKLEIFNKWGEKIFESNDFHVGWDGYYQGELMPQNVYIWKAEGKFANGKTFEKMGDVTLVR